MKKLPDKEIKISLQPTGAVFGWVSFLLLAWGVFRFVGPPILLGTAGFFVLFLVRWLCRTQLTDLEMTRVLPRRTFLGESFTIQATLTNRKRFLHSTDLRIADSMIDSSSRTIEAVDSLPGNSSCVIAIPGRLFRRGRNTRRDFKITSHWPLGLFEGEYFGRYGKTDDSPNSGVLVVPRPLIPKFLSRVLDTIEQESALHSRGAARQSGGVSIPP